MEKYHTLTFYPVGNGDSIFIRLKDDTTWMIDFNAAKDGESEDDPRIDLKKELDKQLPKNRQLDVFMVTHSHRDHFAGFSEYFWLEYAQEYQEDDRIKIGQLWVPQEVILEPQPNSEGKRLRKEARHRLFDKKGEGLKVFGCSKNLIDHINKSEKVTFDEVKEHIIPAGKELDFFKDVNLFVHSPFSGAGEDGNKNESSIVLHASFLEAGEATGVIFGGDCEYSGWDLIVARSEENKNEQKLEFDLFKLAHHCSYTALNCEENKEGKDGCTIPTENISRLFSEYSVGKPLLIASCDAIPPKSKKDESGPPHYQAAEYYRNKTGDSTFLVTMENEKDGKKVKPIVIEIRKNGAQVKGTQLRKSSAESKPTKWGTHFGGKK